MHIDILGPRFLKARSPKVIAYARYIDAADGVEFLCPLCFERNHGPVGTHLIVCWREGVSQEIPPQGGRWYLSGDGYANLTIAPSIHIPEGCGAHFFVTNGEIIWA